MQSEIKTWINNKNFRVDVFDHQNTVFAIESIKEFVELYCKYESENLKLRFIPTENSSVGNSELEYSSKVLEQEAIILRTRSDIFERDINELRKNRIQVENDYQVKLLLRKNEVMEIEVIFWDE